jgi:hypothetical protein
VLKGDILVYVVNCIYYIFSVIISSLYFYCIWCTEKYTGKIMHIITHSSFCALNFKLPACRPNSAEVARTIHKEAQGLYQRSHLGHGPLNCARVSLEIIYDPEVLQLSPYLYWLRFWPCLKKLNCVRMPQEGSVWKRKYLIVSLPWAERECVSSDERSYTKRSLKFYLTIYWFLFIYWACTN